MHLNENDCETAATERQLEFAKKNSSDHPKGCFKTDDVVFNTHPVGKRNIHNAPICKGTAK